MLALGAVELWAAVPAGLALQLHPVATGVAAAAGAILGVAAVILLGDKVRNRLLRGRGGEEGGRLGGLRRLWTRFGVVGLGLLAPLLTGAPLGAALGVALGAPAGRLFLWMVVGIALWSAALTVVGVVGMEALGAWFR